MTDSRLSIEILHDRDPDGECTLRVFVNGVEVDNVVEASIDPGAGWTRDDWNESTRAWADDATLSEPFRQAVLDAREAASESKYVE